MLPYIVSILTGLTIAFFSQFAEAAFLPVCDRTPQISAALEKLTNKKCADIVPDDLLSIKRVAVNKTGITAFKVDDFTGLTNMDTLNIRSNPYTELPEGLFKDLVHLKTLVIIDTGLKNYPNDYLEFNPEIENIHVFRNPVRQISETVFARLQNAKNLKVLDVDSVLFAPEISRLQKLFPVGGTVELILN